MASCVLYSEVMFYICVFDHMLILSVSLNYTYLLNEYGIIWIKTLWNG